jgi:hypothetical protein
VRACAVGRWEGPQPAVSLPAAIPAPAPPRLPVPIAVATLAVIPLAPDTNARHVCACFRQERARGKALSRRAWACVPLCKPAVAVALVVAMVRVAAVAVVVAVTLATIGPLFFLLLLRELRLEHGSPPAGGGDSVR